MAILKIKQSDGSWLEVGGAKNSVQYVPQTLTESEKKTALVNLSSIYVTGSEIANDYMNNLAVGQYSTAKGFRTSTISDYSSAEGWGSSSPLIERIVIGTVLPADRGGYYNFFPDPLPYGTTPLAIENYSYWILKIFDNYYKIDGVQYIDSMTYRFHEGIGLPIDEYGETGCTLICIEGGAWGVASHAEGRWSMAAGEATHAEGVSTTAEGTGSHAEGYLARCTGPESHAEGYDTLASGYYGSHAEGYETIASGFRGPHAEGHNTTASGDYGSHAEGTETIASGDYGSHAEGDTTIAKGFSAHAEGGGTLAAGDYSHAEGSRSVAIGEFAHAEGFGELDFLLLLEQKGIALEEIDQEKIIELYSESRRSAHIAYGEHSHIEGRNNLASGDSAHAEGLKTHAEGICSHAEGASTTASGTYAHAEGGSTVASGITSHAEGFQTDAVGESSHAEGSYTIAAGTNQHVQGIYNIEDTENTYAHIVGNGEYDFNESMIKRSNAHTIDWKGNAWFAGDVYVGSTSGTNKDTGSKKLTTEDVVDTKVATKTSVTVGGVHQETFDADTKMNALENKATSYIIPTIPYGSKQPTTRILATGMSEIWSGRVPYYFNNTTEHSVPQNGWLVTATPQYDGDCANKKYVDDNFVSKNGDSSINGNLSITGDLHIAGTTYTEDAETLRIADNIIELNSNKADHTTILSGMAINKNADSTYGIMYDPTSDTVKLGEGKTENGVFAFNNDEGAPLTVRDDSSNIADGAIMIFDKSKNKLVDSGYTIDGFKQWVREYIESYMSTTTTIDPDGGEIIEMTVAENLISEKDGILKIGG